MALMGNAEIVVAGQQDKMLSINVIRGSVMKKVPQIPCRDIAKCFQRMQTCRYLPLSNLFWLYRHR
jgi:hypothetical protein